MKFLRSHGLAIGAVILIALLGVLSIWQDQAVAFVGVLTVGVSAWEIARRNDQERERLREEDRREREARREEERREKKVGVYSDILDFWFTMLMGTDKEKQKANNGATRRLRDQTEQLIPWGSNDVLLAMSSIRTAEVESLNIMTAFTNLMLAIRADLGHLPGEVDGYTIATLFVNDMSRDKWRDMTAASDP